MPHRDAQHMQRIAVTHYTAFCTFINKPDQPLLGIPCFTSGPIRAQPLKLCQQTLLGLQFQRFDRRSQPAKRSILKCRISPFTA
ncbi:Phage-related protein [Pseudomonas syringae pv. actinidiae]|uniref:Phage-related protein n=1 Tax=Pseudomonas syringae pv. actinidiae TaxID=103796 RepID=A0AAN4PZV5_PSESF|nr:Phage-related protein [Pseudomonas syringae pv. actinidiae]